VKIGLKEIEFLPQTLIFNPMHYICNPMFEISKVGVRNFELLPKIKFLYFLILPKL